MATYNGNKTSSSHRNYDYSSRFRSKKPIWQSKSVANHENKPSQNDHYNYTVNLRLAPVENGIKCFNTHDDNIQSFIGLNAFNNYFHSLLPEHKSFSLPDVWDGYFHITLGKFRLDTGINYEARKRSLIAYIQEHSQPEQHYGPVFPCKFRTTGLNVYSGEHRHAEAEGIDFVTLEVKDVYNVLTQLHPFLNIIENGVRHVQGQWHSKSIDEYRDTLHVTVRKYNDDHSKWSSRYIQNCGIIKLVEQHPLEFECIALDIVQTRRQARGQRSGQQWWIGVTGIPAQCNNCDQQFWNDSPDRCSRCRSYGGGYRCSGCGYNEEHKWPGYCQGCREYEQLKPLWSTRS